MLLVSLWCKLFLKWGNWEGHVEFFESVVLKIIWNQTYVLGLSQWIIWIKMALPLSSPICLCYKGRLLALSYILYILILISSYKIYQILSWWLNCAGTWNWPKFHAQGAACSKKRKRKESREHVYYKHQWLELKNTTLRWPRFRKTNRKCSLSNSDPNS